MACHTCGRYTVTFDPDNPVQRCDLPAAKGWPSDINLKTFILSYAGVFGGQYCFYYSDAAWRARIICNSLDNSKVQLKIGYHYTSVFPYNFLVFDSSGNDVSDDWDDGQAANVIACKIRAQFNPSTLKQIYNPAENKAQMIHECVPTGGYIPTGCWTFVSGDSTGCRGIANIVWDNTGC